VTWFQEPVSDKYVKQTSISCSHSQGTFYTQITQQLSPINSY